jgi:hypothetical protein
MPGSLSVVTVDDDPEFMDLFSGWLRSVWRSLYPDVALELHFLQSPLEAIRYLEETRTADVLITSVEFSARDDDDPVFRTDVIGAAARTDVPVTLALAMWRREAAGGSLRDRCEEYAYRHFRYREQFLFRYKEQFVDEDAYNDLCEDIYRRLVELEAVDHVRVSVAERDLLTAGVVQEVGAGVIGWLLSQLVPDQRVKQLDLRFLAQGGSGAYVFEAVTDSGRRLALKLARDREILHDEVEGHPDVGEMSGALYGECRPVRPEEIPRSRGWHAIAHGFETEAQTLREWLTDDPPESSVEAFLNRLFLGQGLTRRYAATMRVADARSILDALRLPVIARARFGREVNGLAETIRDCGQLGAAEFEGTLSRLAVFLNSDRVGDQECPTGAVQCRCHGDLHTGNVFVREQSSPFLIDLSGRYVHWAADLTRLAVDLVLMCYGGGLASHRWEFVPDWRRVLLGLSMRDERVVSWVVPEAPRAAVVQAVVWLLRHAEEIYGVIARGTRREFPPWEFQAAICMELLYAVSRSDIPPPKRVAGFLAAADILADTEERLGELP